MSVLITIGKEVTIDLISNLCFIKGYANHEGFAEGFDVLKNRRAEGS